MTALIRPLFSAGFNGTDADDLAALLKAVVDPSRLKILALLKSRGEMTVMALTAVLPLSQPTVSHHLGILGAAGLVDAERRGACVYRSLNTARIRQVSRLLDPGWRK